LAERIYKLIDYNYSGGLNWDEFLKLMVVIRAKTLKDKINLFIRIADEDGNGLLSYEEIFNLAKVCLSKYVKEDDDFMDMLCSFFTDLIFEAVDIEVDEEIPLSTIRQAIINGNKDSDLLAMFCGADI
jgi:hypothetical protein